MLLNNYQIEQAVNNGEIEIAPFEKNNLQAASYDLRIGYQGATTSTKKLVNIKEQGYLIINPGDFGILTVFEEIRLNNQHAARFGLRSKYARKGLIATAGPQIDPGYHGRLIIGITNLTPKPISLPFKDHLLTIEFHRLEDPSTKPYQGPYQDKLELGAEEIECITESESLALSEVLRTLQVLTQTVGGLSKHLKIIEWSIPTIITVGLIIIGIIVSLK